MVTSIVRRPGTVGGTRDLNRQKRAADLRAAGLELFLDRGIEAVAIEDVTKAAGMAKGSFYRYYQDKSDLVEGILAGVAQGVGDAFSHAADALGKARDRE